MAIRGAVDIGGTFTDVVAYDDSRGELLLGKALSTPSDLIDGVFTSLDASGAKSDELDFLIHGSTVVINALIERRGARTALVTTRGFRDVYEIGRINRPDAFNLGFTKHEPLLARSGVFEVPERIRADGSVAVPLDELAVRRVAVELARAGVEAVAVVLLHAYRNPAHERRVGELIQEALPDVYVTLSHEISREYREFERTSTTVANAFVGPKVSRYLDRLAGRMVSLNPQTALAIMQSNGGVSDIATAMRQCVQMLESGPAGGVVGATAICEALGLDRAIAFDMGGTTAKSAVIRDLTLPLASDYFLGGYRTGLPLRLPCIDIVEVGTGGGSIAWVDGAGGVHVGPRSAGAEPGPAAYGRGGTEPTITDATVALGQLPPGGMLFGGLRLDGGAALAAVGRLADQVGLDGLAMAAGIVAIGASSMANSVRAVTTQRGLDPREFTLIAYGGNGPLHVSLIARELGITEVVIPPHPSVFSAWGMLMADVRTDVVETRVRTLGHTDTDEAEILADLARLEADCARRLRDSALPSAQIRFERAADMRYVGQEHTVTVAIPADVPAGEWCARLKAAFDQAHLERFSHGAAEEPAQVVSLRVSAIGSLPTPGLRGLRRGDAQPPDKARRGSRRMVFDPARPAADTDVFDRAALLAGDQIHGPAAIEEPSATTLLRPGDTAEVDRFGNIRLRIGG